MALPHFQLMISKRGIQTLQKALKNRAAGRTSLNKLYTSSAV